MKIICQACQSKYTIADDKIQGKVAKIRCRKCGATVLVDASGGGARSNGSSAAPAPGEAWLVSVAEGDQRTLQLHEVVDAYNSGVITGDTYLWKEGMGDWQPLSEVAEVIDALNQANAAASPRVAPHEDYRAPAPVAYAPRAVSYPAPSAYSPPVTTAVAARRETGRGRGDLFGGGRGEEEVATSAPPQAMSRGSGSSSLLGGVSGGNAGTQRSGLTGARDEHSVLFSLSALTNTAKAPSMPPSASYGGGARNEDSGLIDLNALARVQQQARAAEAPAAPLATPFLFPAALGSMETFHTPEEPKKSSMPMIIGGGLAVAGIAIALAIFAGARKEEIPPLPAGAAVSAAAPEPLPVMSAAAEAPSAEAAPAPAPSAKVAAKKVGGGGARPNKPSAGAGVGPAPPVLPPPTPKAKSPCGCAGGDLQCQIRCSATGK